MQYIYAAGIGAKVKKNKGSIFGKFRNIPQFDVFLVIKFYYIQKHHMIVIYGFELNTVLQKYCIAKHTPEIAMISGTHVH